MLGNFFHNLGDRIFAIGGALTLSQAPTFMQHYIQNLAGHVDELRSQVNQLVQAAEISGKTLPEFIQKFTDSPDFDSSMLGNIMQVMVDRYASLSMGYQALLNSNFWDRPLVFTKYFNWDVAKSTYENFHWGLTLTPEGLVYALIGLYLGVVIYFILCKCFHILSWPWSKRQTIPTK